MTELLRYGQLIKIQFNGDFNGILSAIGYKYLLIKETGQKISIFKIQILMMNNLPLFRIFKKLYFILHQN